MVRQMLNKKKFNNQSGFTLLEVLAAITILSIVLITFFSFFSQGILFSSKNEDKIVAVNLARDVLGVIKTNEQMIDSSNTSEEIITTFLTELKLESTPPYCFTQYNDCYYPRVSILPPTPEEERLNLVRVKVEIYLEEERLLTETYGYLKTED